MKFKKIMLLTICLCFCVSTLVGCGSLKSLKNTFSSTTSGQGISNNRTPPSGNPSGGTPPSGNPPSGNMSGEKPTNNK